jgi:SAM-dependent methyltransferase
MRRGLDQIHEAVVERGASAAAAIERLTATLEAARAEAPTEVWSQQARDLVVSHPLVHLVHQDPFTRRCFYKPRGYAGDARMLDYIYGEADDDDSTLLGRQFLDATTARPAPSAVRNRRDVLAAAIDTVALRVDRPRVMAVACGHLREARLSAAVRERQIGEFVAFDQDARSLAVVSCELSDLGVRAVHGRVRDLIARRAVAHLGTFDLIYAAGLYDYLDDQVASRLTAALANLLRPQGTLLVANFLPDIPDRAYMETFMDWRLVYRTLPQLESLLLERADRIELQRSFIEPQENIAFVEVTCASC